MFKDDMKIAAPSHAGCLDIRAHFNRQGLRFDDDRRRAEPGKNADHDGQVDDTQAEQRTQHDQYRDGGRHDDQVSRAHENGIDDATIISGDSANGSSDDQCDC